MPDGNPECPQSLELFVKMLAAPGLEDDDDVAGIATFCTDLDAGNHASRFRPVFRLSKLSHWFHVRGAGFRLCSSVS